MGRTGCAYVPRFELAVRARADPGLWERLVASIDLAARPPQILSVTPAAEALGVRTGEVASRVRARLPELTCVSPDPAACAAAEREVFSKLATIAPRLDSDGRGAFFLGLDGMERLWPEDGPVLARLSAIFAELGLPVRCAISDTPFEAWVRALWPGNRKTPLDRVPLSELMLGGMARELFALLGLGTAGALSRLPPGTLAARLGEEGAQLERLWKGERFPAWPTVQKLPREAESVELDLELALDGLEPLLFAFQSLLERLLAAVGAERLALVELLVWVRLDDRKEHCERFIPEGPTLQVSTLLELLTLWLERRPFGAPVASLRLTAARVGPATQAQLSLLRQKEEQAASARAQAIARLSAAFGLDAVSKPMLRNTYRPEERLAWVAVSEEVKPVATSRAAFAPLTLALRQIDPPEPVVIRPGPMLQRRGQPAVRIIQIDGPQRLRGEWWKAELNRSYSWIRLTTGELCWIFREGDGVFLQAIGD